MEPSETEPYVRSLGVTVTVYQFRVRVKFAVMVMSVVIC